MQKYVLTFISFRFILGLLHFICVEMRSAISLLNEWLIDWLIVVSNNATLKT